MTRDEVRACFAHRQKAWNARDAEELADTHRADGTIESPIFGTIQGRTAILKAYEALFRMFEEWEYRGEEPVVDGDRAVQAFTARGVHVGEFMGLAGTGRRFEIEGVALYELQADLIVHERRIYDFTGLLIQIGVLRGKPARP